MEVKDFAKAILFGNTLEEKLVKAPDFSDEMPGSAIKTPKLPGRIKTLSIAGRAKFPKDLNTDSSRGQMLHFFANHELLAMELMALLLLRFPNADPNFRMSMVHTICEEQAHMRLYLGRMNELGIGFGELPVSTYFWDSMKEMKSPLEFVAQMSLTFEQANLDYSLFYLEEVEKVGDVATAEILKQVYEEEIGHVKNGLKWFNSWRDPNYTDWESYCRLLPPPMTPSRGKGNVFSFEARERVGFSKPFIRNMHVYSSSQGRPPTVRIFNAAMELELARGKKGYSSSAVSHQAIEDLDVLPSYLSDTDDIILVHKKPSLSWLESLKSLNAGSVEYIEKENLNSIKDRKLSGIQPWGWSPDMLNQLSPLLGQVSPQLSWTETPDKEFSKLSKLSSKVTTFEFSKDYYLNHSNPHFGTRSVIGKCLTDFLRVDEEINALLSEGQVPLLKAPWGSSGNQVRTIRSSIDWNTASQGWVRNILKNQKAVLIESHRNRIADLSMQLYLTNERIKFLGVRHTEVDSQFQYCKSHAGKTLQSLPKNVLRFIKENGILLEWEKMIRAYALTLQDQGYCGPVGIDAFVWKEKGKLYFRPLVEANIRWTMGHVFLGVEKLVASNRPAYWTLLKRNKSIPNLSTHAKELAQQYPLKVSTKERGSKIEDGVFFTNDPLHSKQVLSALFVGSACIENYSPDNKGK